jgi:hypothetical protein
MVAVSEGEVRFQGLIHLTASQRIITTLPSFTVLRTVAESGLWNPVCGPES